MDRVLYIVNRSNQRGGRMLSLIDLIETETLTFRQAAWILQRIEQGSSWLVGGAPGGAGKTAVVGALLALLPPGTPVTLTTMDSGWRNARPGDCLVAYEVGDGAYEAYLWGADVQSLTERGLQGCRIVSNLHADSLEEARAIVVDRCGAREEGFRAFDLFIPISVRGGFVSMSRKIDTMFYAGGDAWHEYDPGHVPSDREVVLERFLRDTAERGVRKIEDVRGAWLELTAAEGRSEGEGEDPGAGEAGPG